jgi:hypothetical protein
MFALAMAVLDALLQGASSGPGKLRNMPVVCVRLIAQFKAQRRACRTAKNASGRLTSRPASVTARHVNRLRRLAPSTRLLLATVLALWLGVRLLTPAGFMPSFAGGTVAIVECPGADGAPAATAMPDMAGMDMSGMAVAEHGDVSGKHGFHQSCPYAPASSLAGLVTGFAVFAVVLLLAALPPAARALLAVRRHATRERPPAQGPPLLA